MFSFCIRKNLLSVGWAKCNIPGETLCRCHKCGESRSGADEVAGAGADAGAGGVQVQV